MEFFEYIKNNNLTSDYLQTNITIEHLSKHCASVDAVLEHKGDSGVIYCVWGEFDISRECINGGVRFSLLNCINNIIWSVTTGHEPDPQQTVIYLSMNREQQEIDFVDTMKTFVVDLRQGLSQL